MKILILGASGTLGKALCSEVASRRFTCIGLARRSAEIRADIRDAATLSACISQHCPDIVVNAAALIDLPLCERDPGLADSINAQPIAAITTACQQVGSKFVQISTDHFFTGDGDKLHDEEAKTVLVNVYAASKFRGETLALRNPRALVIRTNFTGWRGGDSPTLIEWAVNALKTRAPLVLFDDFWTSTADAASVARATLDLALADASGIVNVAARQVATKKAFIYEVAWQMGIDLSWSQTGSVATLSPKRADSLGLDVTKAEKLLQYPLPTLQQTVANLLAARPRNEK